MKRLIITRGDCEFISTVLRSSTGTALPAKAKTPGEERGWTEISRRCRGPQACKGTVKTQGQVPGLVARATAIAKMQPYSKVQGPFSGMRWGNTAAQRQECKTVTVRRSGTVSHSTYTKYENKVVYSILLTCSAFEFLILE